MYERNVVFGFMKDIFYCSTVICILDERIPLNIASSFSSFLYFFLFFWVLAPESLRPTVVPAWNLTCISPWRCTGLKRIISVGKCALESYNNLKVVGYGNKISIKNFKILSCLCSHIFVYIRKLFEPPIYLKHWSNLF